MIQSTISFYAMEFYKQFAAYTTQQLQELWHDVFCDLRGQASRLHPG